MDGITTYYSILDISPGSNLGEIRKAYHAKAKLLHPDVNSSPQAHLQFIRIREAFDKITLDKNQKKLSKPENAGYGTGSQMHFNDYQYTHIHVHRPLYKKPKIDLTEIWLGKVFFISMHLVFALTGLLIFLNPIILALRNNFDPEKPLIDSLFIAFGSMIFGTIVVILVVRSLFSFIRKYH